jgi:anti-sigma B factor antagonist
MTIGRIRAMAREHSEGAVGSGASSLRIERHHRGSGLHVDIVGEIDAASSGEFSDGLLDAAESGSGPIVVNLGNVSFLDSAGLHALVHARKSAGPRLRLGTVNPAVRRVLEMTALLGHLGRGDDPTDSS